MNINQLRLKLYEQKMSQASLARSLQISEKALSLKMCGKKRFWLDEVVSICKILGIQDPREIFF